MAASISFMLAIQHAVAWGQRGVATGAATFSRTIGGAVGVGLLGASLTWELSRRLASAGGSGIDIAAALRPESHRLLGSLQLSLVQTHLGLTLRDVYIQITLFAVVSMVCALWLPGKKATLSQHSATEPEDLEDQGLAVVASEM